ncbi:hypothetical protein Y032_1092g3590 [Ancylostoma ceylanicum]|uniref:Uncharacterized protein n=1 Tax=Ancylostoma ceylanicum TaxID=53326 RepID=A0A016W7I2_9BILA|nr:hypothetical protein Y032_1092g3590 [Ancylostoma ceylanicum]
MTRSGDGVDYESLSSRCRPDKDSRNYFNISARACSSDWINCIGYGPRRIVGVTASNCVRMMAELLA